MKKRTFNKKSVALVLAGVTLIGGIAGGTLAWLTDKTGAVTNMFTESNIDVSLEETTGEEYQMIPGWTIEKDPKASVSDDSEDCYLFVKIEETGVSFVPNDEVMPKVYSFDDFLKYEIAEGWEKLEDGVYYKAFIDGNSSNEKGTQYSILKDDQVTVQETVTKTMMDELSEYEVNPKLEFTAYAVQLWKSNKPEDMSDVTAVNNAKFTPREAWEKVGTN